MEQSVHALFQQNRDTREGQSHKILVGLTAPDGVVIKSWNPRIGPSSFDERGCSGGTRKSSERRWIKVLKNFTSSVNS
jgi:hypothetical protein